MGYKDLRSFIEFLEEKDQLVRVQAPVSPELEITEIIDRLSKGTDKKNKAVLFENPAGFDVPVLMNAFGSHDRMAWALGVERLEELNTRLSALLDMHMPTGLGGALSRGGELLGALMAAGVKPKKVRSAAVQEVVEKDNPSIAFLPILKCWPKDGGKFITLPQVITENPATGARNVGMYRLQVIDDKTLLVHWQRHKGGAEHEARA
jgi:4-hydroxy-3-polyprenylbenzoate decarboxylase